MTGIFKKCIMSIMIILVIIITAVNMFHYLSNGKKGKEYYIDTFYKNQSFFKEITNSLMEPDNEMYFFKESGEIFLNQNEKNIKLSSSSLDEKTKGNIKRAIYGENIGTIVRNFF